MNKKETLDQLPATLKKLRKTCKVSQERMAQTLQVDQAAISRMESGQQVISASNLIQIGHFFKLPIDSIVNGQINYWALARVFGQRPELKKRYKDQKGAFVREFLPILSYLNQTAGESWTREALSHFSIESIPFIDPNEEISKNFFLDFLVYCIEERRLNQSSISSLAKEYSNPKIYGDYSRLIFSAKDPMSMAITFSNSSVLHNSLMETKVLEMGRGQVVIGLEKKDHIGGKKFLTESGLGDFLCDFEIQKFDHLLLASFKNNYSIKYHKEFSQGLKGQAEVLITAS